uniref:Extended synaptotagmin-like protein 1a n=1 Tax=Anabas testudineus TaxID=64144 RepID=A0A7N6ATL5_ANATE
MPTADAEPGMTADTADAAPALPNQAHGERAVSVLWSFGKCLGALLPVYLAGYYGFSITVVLFGLMIYIGWKHSRLEKLMRLKSAMYLLENEREFTTEKAFRTKRDLPTWVSVNFPDVEKVEWVNKILQQAWPFIGQYLEKLLVDIIAPAIRASSVHLQTLSFTKVNIGDKALKIVGVKAHTENDKRQVMLDLYLSYAGDVEVNVEIKKYFCKAGVKGIQLHGMLRVILEPLIGDVPLVGAVTLFFIRRPKLDINWTGLTNLLDIPGLNAMSDTMIMDAIASHLVLPNRLTVPLVADLHVAQLRSPLPRGVVRIHLLEAEDLTAKDTVIKGLIDGKSDPYAVLRVGTQIFTSHHVDSNLNPQWREMYEVIVHEVPGQELEVEVFDKDPDQDDFLGRYKTGDPPSAAILAVYLDQAFELPMRKGNKDPSPIVQISVQDTTKESKTCYGTNNPVWEDAFTFFIQDPHKQDIDIQVKDDDRSLSLGSLTIPLSRILTTPELTMDQWFQLENSSLASRIYMKIVLRVGTLRLSFFLYIINTHVNPMGPGGLAKPAPGRPLHTTPDSEFATEGVLRINLVEAQNLIAKDNFMGGMVKGKSDPYVKIRVAGITFRSHTIKENLNPLWNELYEVILTQLPGQEIQFELFDKDIDQDDFLGRWVQAVEKENMSWYTLNDVKSGRVHLVLEWLPRVSDISRLEPVSFKKYIYIYCFILIYSGNMLRSDSIQLQCKKCCHGFVQNCILNCACNKKKTFFDKSSQYVLCFFAKICERSTSPRWDEAFHFLVRDPREEILTLSHSWGQALGSLTLPLQEVLTESGLVLDRWLNLDGALPESQILLRATLKILDTQLATCRKAPGDAGSDPAEGEVIPRWDPSHLDLRHRAGFPVNTTAQVKLTISYSTEESRLFITVHSCRALAACSKDGADPYVSFILLPDKKATTKRRTSTKKRDLNPEFNERFDFDFSLEESTQRRLDLSVKNSVSFMSRERELIGKLQLDLDQIDLKTGVTQWYWFKQLLNSVVQ